MYLRVAGNANAIGAAISQVGATVEKVVELRGKDKEQAWADVEAEARKKVISMGAVESTVVRMFLHGCSHLDQLCFFGFFSHLRFLGCSSQGLSSSPVSVRQSWMVLPLHCCW